VHEVRSPLAALAAIAQALSGGDRLDDEAFRRLLDLAVTAARGIERVVADAAVGALRLERTDVAQVVRDAVAAAALAGADVRVDIEPELLLIEGDPVRLRQAVDNLVANAVLHGSAEGEIRVSAVLRAEAICVSVADSGAGIPAEELARIFDPGVRLDPEQPGMGLGLYVARAVAEAHGGTLDVESALGEGTTFTLSLPTLHR
jgi:two-component system sensor histidine kinase BaeS